MNTSRSFCPSSSINPFNGWDINQSDFTAVFDVNKTASAEIAAELGAKDCGALSEVTEAAEIIFTVVTNDDAMRAIFLQDGDNLFSGASGKTFINCATLSPGIHKEVYEAGKEVEEILTKINESYELKEDIDDKENEDVDKNEENKKHDSLDPQRQT